MTAAVVLVVLAAAAGAAPPSEMPPGAPGSGPVGASGYGDSGILGTGWTVTAGYFFKDTMFYSGARGGPVVAAGRTIPVFSWLGVWAGAGAFLARGTYGAEAAGSRFRTAFDETAFHFELGLVTPWLPFPVSLALYRHSTSLDDSAVSGALAGSAFSGRSAGWGAGANVRIMFEYFLSGRHGRHRGLALVGGYAGFMDLSPVNVRTRGPAGELEHRDWKPFKGESLQVGLEYEF